MHPDGTVFLAVDDNAVRSSIRAMLAGDGVPVRRFSSVARFVDDFDPLERGCMLIAVRARELVELQDAVSAHGWTHPLVIVSAHADLLTAVRVMEAGPAAFITKPIDEDIVLSRIIAAFARDAASRQRQIELADFNRRAERLTPRERQVVHLVVAGHTTKEIALSLTLSPRTIDVHRSHAMIKLGAKHVTDLVRIAILHDFDGCETSAHNGESEEPRRGKKQTHARPQRAARTPRRAV